MSQRKKRALTKTELQDYAEGKSVRELSAGSDLKQSSIRQRLLDLGLIRTKSEATKMSRNRRIDLNAASRLTKKENGPYAAVLSQDWLRRVL
jgi:hypothetical protein